MVPACVPQCFGFVCCGLLVCLAAVVVASSLAVLLYNIAGMYVTEEVGAAARTVLENARTLLVWLVSCFYLAAAHAKHCPPAM